MDNTGIYDNKNKWIQYPYLIAASLLLLIPAFYNHYPLVNPDTATYLASGFKPETPFDRPITYGLVIRILSINGLSLWLSVFFQAFIVAMLIFEIVKKLAPKAYLLKSLAIVATLSLLTSLSWVASQVQPDIFTPIGFLTMILILIDGDSKKMKISLYVLYFISIAIHLSHPLLFTLMLISIFLFKSLFTKKECYKQLNIKLLTLFILTISAISVMGPALSKSKHVFFTGSLLEKGILKKYLDDNCSSKQLKLCEYKDALPRKSDDFIWDENSPLYKIGGWKGTKDEFNSISNDILTTPKYLGPLISSCLKATLQQATTFSIGGGNTAFPPGSNVNQRISEYLPNEQAAFNRARQNNENIQLRFSTPNQVFTVIIALSAVALIIILLQWKRLTNELQLVLFICLTGTLLNCIDCATFSVVHGRYCARMIWLLPLCVLATLISGKRPKPGK